MVEVQDRALTIDSQFIVLEGVEGAGKTTNLAFLQELIADYAIDLDVTREPGGTDLAEQLRDLLLHYTAEPVEPMTELLLMFAARQQHIQQRIKPQLAQGSWVLCDRFVDATYAYQGGGRGFDRVMIEQLEQICLQGFAPDWVIFLDLPCELSAARVQARGETDRFEQEHQAFFERVRAVYLQRAQDHPNYTIIDASQPISAVQADIRAAFLARYDLPAEGAANGD